ncbi:tetratricopeptide repeat protein [Aeromonas sp. 164P]
MSVINQMLKDLDARQPGNETRARYQPVVRTPAWLLAIVTLTSLLGLILLGWRGWHYWQSDVQAQSRPPSLSAPAKPLMVDATPAASVEVVADAPAAPHQAAPLAQPEPLDDRALQAERKAEDARLAEPLDDHALQAERQAEDALLAEPLDDHALQAERQAEDALLAELAGSAEAAALTAEPGSNPQVDAVPASRMSAKNELKIERVALSPAELATLAERKALAATARGDLTEAERHYRAWLDQQPRAVAPRRQLAALWYGQGRLGEAYRLLEEGVRLLPEVGDFRLLLARLALADGQRRQALDWLAGARPPLARNLDYYATLAALSQELGLSQEARELYLQLLRSKPEQARWWLGLGVAEEQLGQPLRALEAYRSAALHGGLGDETGRWLAERIAALAANYE